MTHAKGEVALAEPEKLARRQIDAQLAVCGWVVQDYKQFDPSAGRGIALREAPLKSGTCDYLLLVDRKAAGVIEAKKEGTLLSGVAEQSAHYAVNLPDFIQSVQVGTLPFLYESTLLLHGIGGELEEDLPVITKDALAGKHGEYEIVLANPPFGKKSSVTITNGAGESSRESLIINRDDFWATTSNKQLNFLQHIFTILKQHGRAAVVLPDNVLFEGGAGETIRRELLKQADVHTLLRLPTGIFYAQGVKANVLFFDRKPAQEKPWTQKLWIYDLRTNLHFTLKENTLKRSDLDDFVSCFNPKNRINRKESERFKSFTYEELTKRDKVNLDIFWRKDDALEESANLPAPEIIAADIAADLEAALEQFATIAEDLNGAPVK